MSDFVQNYFEIAQESGKDFNPIISFQQCCRASSFLVLRDDLVQLYPSSELAAGVFAALVNRALSESLGTQALNTPLNSFVVERGHRIRLELAMLKRSSVRPGRVLRAPKLGFDGHVWRESCS